MRLQCGFFPSVSRRVPTIRFEKFLLALSSGLSVSGAAKAAGVSHRAMYDRRNRDTEFAVAWQDAVKAGVDVLEDEAFRRGVEGVERRIFYKAKCIDVVREYSDALLIALLKARAPERYRERHKISHGATVSGDWQARIAAARKRAGFDPEA